MENKELDKKAVELNEDELGDISGGMNMPVLTDEEKKSMEQGVLSREKLTYY